MKINSFIFTIAMLSACCYNTSAQQKVWQDTPTPAEITVHNQPYIILQKEIENKLCDNDWEIDTHNKQGDYVAPFLILKGDPGEDVILRGTTVHYFSPVDRGVTCTVELKSSSPLYTVNNDSMQVQWKAYYAQFGLADQLIEKAAKNHYKYTSEDSAVMDKMKIASDKANTEIARLSNARKLATITMTLNSGWTEYLGESQDFYATKEFPPVHGAAYATLFIKKPWKLDPDTLYYATVYIGNWPVITDLKNRYFFHFVHSDKTPWTDKQHSGTPFLENIKVIIQGETYDRVMKVIHNIDWTKLEALVKG